MLEQYRSIAPQGFVDMIYKLAQPLRNKSILHLNSTRAGGGVAEILTRLIPLFQDLGIDARWEVIEGDKEFFRITKTLHNALQGMEKVSLSEADIEYWRKVNEKNVSELNLEADLVIIHDPQPLPLIQFRKRKPWIWRCHIDLSSPNMDVWRKCEIYVGQYDGAIISMPSFSRKLAIPEYVIPPSIDPLSSKNRELDSEEVAAVLKKLKISTKLPIILQVSRFDWFKDPLGVIEAYRIARDYEPCQLLLVGGPADDDPEAEVVFQLVKQQARTVPDVSVLMLPPDSHHEINALQRAAAVVVQKSTKEGFGLTVSEALWKKKAVVGGFAGGIPSQVWFGVTGFTVNSIEGCAYRIRQLLTNPDLARKLGENGHKLVREKFLITRHLADYLVLMHKYCL